ncbi:transcriptional regulator [Thermoplasma sp.]|uniref:transcriptional regulator n=1 Tax=Thermoplasma sp. TaxID=1973142 RepID=UPI00126FE0B7|nr:transcriptional regulator [Thermoplasma sp.]KAA8922002.1 MAG: transcriptional regulator [Thermoplasma sp.]
MKEYSIFREIINDMETLKRHISVIDVLLKEQPIGIIKLAQETGIPEHKIRYSLRILEQENIISPSREGAILTPDFIEHKDQIISDAEKTVEEANAILEQVKKMLQKK